MKGYELMKEIAEGKIKEGTRFKCGYTDIKFDGYNFVDFFGKSILKNCNDIEFAKDDFEIIQEVKKRWRAEIKQEYFYINEHGGVDLMTECNDRSDNYRYKTYNYFRTKSEAKAHLDNINTYYELKELAEELNGDEEIDWENENQIKYRIVYDYNMKNLTWSSTVRNKEIGAIYFLTRDLLEKAKSRIGEDRLVKLFKEKYNE